MKFGTHLWYLCPSLVGLAFFDDKVSSENKRGMIKALDRPFEDGDRRRAEVSIPSCVKLGREDFVNEKTKQLF